MKFRLREGMTAMMLERIGQSLRRNGSGTHWFERYRGEVFVHVSEARDAELLEEEFSELLTPYDK